MRKRVLSISAQKPNSTGSGVYLTELVKAFCECGYEQAVIAGVELGEQVTLPSGVKFCPVSFKSKELPFPVVGMSDVMPYDNTRYCDMTEEMTAQFMQAFEGVIKQVIDDFRPDVIICHHLYLVTALTCQVAKDIPVYGICHSTCIRQFRKNELKKEFIKENINRLDRIYALHCEQKKEIQEVFGICSDKISILGAGYNDKLFFPEKKATEKLCICFAGKVSQAKGVMSLLRCLPYLGLEKQQFEVVLAGGSGDTEELEQIKEYAKNCPFHIRFAGKLPQEELSKLYQQSQIFVLPSFYEGLPLTLIEAMACGCLCVAASWPGVKEWVEEKIPDAKVEFVSLPEMEKPGVPIESELPEYEKELAEALVKMIEQSKRGIQQEDVTRLSWKEVAKCCVE